MRFSYQWLKELVDIPVDARTLAKELTMAGIQLEAMQEVPGDFVLDFEVTVNRPDCLSVSGLAREVAAIFGSPLPKLPPLHPIEILRFETAEGNFHTGDRAIRIVLEDPESCPRYCGQIIAGVKVGPSPSWIVEKLERCGLRSINNVVDITNLVMLELGQPLHAFDYGKLAEGTIRVRKARNESLMMIDGRERMLQDSMLAIADAHSAVAVAGVMGGKDSEVSNETSVLLLESAYFSPPSIRTTAKTLELSTDASYRFERGVDYNMQATACKRVALLLQEIAGGEVYPVVDVCARLFSAPRVPLRIERIDRILGKKIESAFVERTLNSLGFRQVAANLWEVPSYRVDVSREIDLIEEVARHYGYNRFPDTLPRAGKKYQPDYNTYELERMFSNFLRAARFDEAYTYSFAPASAEGRTRILNPISETAVELRTSLIPNLLESVAHNLRHRNRQVRLFEIGRVFLRAGEKVALGIVMQGDYSDLKGAVEAAITAMNYPQPSFEKGDIYVQEMKIGEIRQLVLDGDAVQASEIYLSDLIFLPGRKLSYQPIIPYPFVERDASFILEEKIPYSDLQKTVQTLQPENLRSYRLVDRYKGPNTPPGKVSLTFQFVFQSENRTLTSDEVDQSFRKITEAFAEKFGAELRK